MIDGADGSTAAVVDNYLQAVIARVNMQLIEQTLGLKEPPISARVLIYFNPALLSANFIVPGLAGLVLIMICALLTSIAVAREKETGTMEQILTTPVKAQQIILGKVAPYLVIGVIDTALILLAGRILFDVPMNGSWLALSAYSLLYLIIALSIGILISTLVKTQQVAMIMALTITLLPTMLLSGFIFEQSSMPVVLQYIGKIIPATYYLKIIRGIMLIGRNWYPVEGGVLIGMSVLLLTVAVKRFTGRLD